MPPAKSGVGIDDHMLVIFRTPENFFEHRSPQGIEPGNRQIQNPPRGNIQGLLIHHRADVEYFQVDSLADRDFFNSIEIRTLIDADLTGNYCAHGAEYKRGKRRKNMR